MVGLKVSSNLHRYALPLAILGPVLAAILIGGKIFNPHPEVGLRVSPAGEPTRSRSASKRTPSPAVHTQPQVVTDYKRPSPFEPPHTGHVSIGKTKPGKVESSESRRSVSEQSKPIVAALHVIASNTVPPNAGGATHQAPIAAHAAEWPMREDETGRASFFSSGANGALTARGARLDPEELTAAHARYPLGSRVKVTNLANGKTVEVRIVDRFPDSPKRIINLSTAAARDLDFIRAGTALVRLEFVRQDVGL